MRMKRFTMQIEAWPRDGCTLGACWWSVLHTHQWIITDGNNSPGAKLGINFDGNRSLMAWLWRPWLVIGSDVFGQGIVTTRDCSTSPIQAASCDDHQRDGGSLAPGYTRSGCYLWLSSCMSVVNSS